MKRWLAWVLMFTMLCGGLAAAQAAPVAGPVSVSYKGIDFEVMVEEWSFGGPDGGYVRVQASNKESMVRLIVEGNELGMTPSEGIVLDVTSGAPFFTGIWAGLEGRAGFIPFDRAEAHDEFVTFFFTTNETPAAIYLYPKDGGADTYVRVETGLTQDTAAQADSGGTGGSQRIAFTLNGVRYEVMELQDEPYNQADNLLDGLEGHAILFTYQSSGLSDAGNKMLFSGAKLIAPDGKEIRTYSNYGNSANPYTLYFGLPDDLMLADCILKIPADEGEMLFPLDGTYVGDASSPGTAPPQETPAPVEEEPETPLEPETSPEPEITPAPETSAKGAEQVLDLLATLAEEATDPWQKAIFAAGAEDFSVEEDVISFSLRAFDPKIKTLGEYNADTREYWFEDMLENMAGYELEASLTSGEDGFTEDSLRTLKRLVRTTAETSLAAFNQRAIRIAIADRILPMPVAKLASAGELESLELSDAYFDLFSREPALRDVYAEDYVPLFYAQVSQSMNVRGGPHSLVFNCKGADPAQMMEKASATVMEAMRIRYKANELESWEISEALLEALVTEANTTRRREGTAFTLSMDIDEMIGGSFGEDYEAYLAAYAYDDVLDTLCEEIWQLPDASPQPFPKNGYLSGNNNGTKVIIKAPDDGRGRYIQIRDADTDEERVALFVNSGGSATVYVKRGMVYLLIASGENWYGMEGLFGEEGYYSKTVDTEILGGDYYHTFTLETSDEGNVSVLGADMDDFMR